MVAAFLFVLLLVPLAGCGLSPMYAQRDDGGVGGAALGWEQVDIAAPGNRVEQMVYQELLQNRPPAQQSRTSAAYELKLQVNESDDGMLRDRLSRRRLTVNYALVRRADGRVVLNGKTFADASYEQTRQHFADARAADAARRAAAKIVARDIRTRVAAFFARGGGVATATGWSGG